MKLWILLLPLVLVELAEDSLVALVVPSVGLQIHLDWLGQVQLR